METINAPNFGVITKIKKMNLANKKLDAQNKFLDMVIKCLVVLTILHLAYRLLN